MHQSDYVLVPAPISSGSSPPTDAWLRMFPRFVDSESATGIITQRHYDRLCGYLTEARDRGSG